MRRVLIATTNEAKLAEYRLLLRDLEIRPVSLVEAGIGGPSPEEVGSTFAENALLKARFYHARSKLPTLADDGGLEIDALGGEPGVKSHRWLAEAGRGDVAPADLDRALVEEVTRRMEGIEPARRRARLKAAAALVFSDGRRVIEKVAEAALEGTIALRPYPDIRPGFPYRAVILLPGRGCYLGELSEEEAAGLSQRKAAVEKLRPWLERIADQGP